MKLDFIEVSGFRGFRDKVRIEFGGGFTVISGRNGVGKSAICDAIEFALTGQIGKYTVESAAKENASDYYWWRGTGVRSFFTARQRYDLRFCQCRGTILARGCLRYSRKRTARKLNIAHW